MKEVKMKNLDFKKFVLGITIISTLAFAPICMLEENPYRVFADTCLGINLVIIIYAAFDKKKKPAEKPVQEKQTIEFSVQNTFFENLYYINSSYSIYKCKFDISYNKEYDDKVRLAVYHFYFNDVYISFGKVFSKEDFAKTDLKSIFAKANIYTSEPEAKDAVNERKRKAASDIIDSIK